MLKSSNPYKICNECKGNLLHLIANEILWRKRKVNTSNSGQDIV